MPRFEFEVTHTITITKTIPVIARDEEAAEEKMDEKISGGLCDKIEVKTPMGWNVDTDTDKQLL